MGDIVELLLLLLLFVKRPIFLEITPDKAHFPRLLEQGCYTPDSLPVNRPIVSLVNYCLGTRVGV